MGSLRFESVFPFPEQPEEDKKAGDPFLADLRKVLTEKIDPDQIDRDGEIPRESIDALAQIGAFGIKTSKQYGGLGLSQTNYLRAASLLGGYCANTSALISAHQSIGVPQPLIIFGTEEQKTRFLPRLAKGDISAFALTEVAVGSDPAKVETRAELSEDGSYYVLNGEKLWCTNGTCASLIVVMARTPDKVIKGKSRRQITAFIVEMDMPGVTVTHRCRFMGLKALYNAVITFENVKVPVENVIYEEGRGLKVALVTLNTGRLTMAAGCTSGSKRCLEICNQWSNDRVQWGSSIGKHEAIANKIALIAARIFAMESITLLTGRMVDMKKADVRLESAMCKMKCTEDSQRIVDDTMQIRGGRGYETAQSLADRGEKPIPVERWYRDCRINTIFEGSSEIMRLLIAREALDTHLTTAGDMLNTTLPAGRRIGSALKAAGFYAKWYPAQWLPLGVQGTSGLDPVLAKHVNTAGRLSRKLARRLFHAMARYGQKLERKHMLLKRFVDIGTEIFTIAVTCSRAQSLLDKAPSNRQCVDLADLYCRNAFLDIHSFFAGIRKNNDRNNYKMAQRILDGEFDWLSEGGISKH